MKIALLFVITLSLCSFGVTAQKVVTGSGNKPYRIFGTVRGRDGSPIAGATICIPALDDCTTTDIGGNFSLDHLANGIYKLQVTMLATETINKTVTVTGKSIQLAFTVASKSAELDSVRVQANTRTFGITRLKDIDGSGIYAGKKSEVIVLKDMTANTATNNARQIYSKVAGLNIYENDGGAGIQLAIGGRGLDPNRVSNFNTRQNGYDISADALGYPESYYTPPAEVLDRIEIVRGAASLEYGTQFGGIINFKMKSGVDSEKVQVVSRLSTGSWGFLNSSTSVGGSTDKFSYYGFYQHKSGNGWRDHSGFNANTGYASATWKPSKRFSLTAQYTHMDYLEQQAGGLNDAMFANNPDTSTKSRNWFKVNWNLGAVLLDYTISSHLHFNSRLFGLLATRSALGIINTVTDPGNGWPRNYRTDDYKNWGNESRLIYTYNSSKETPSVLLAGFRYYHGYTDRQIGDGNGGSTGNKADFAFNKSTEYDSLSYSRYTFPNHNIALFAENIFYLNSKLSIIPGVRYENIYTQADGFYNNFAANLARDVISNQQVVENNTNKRSFLIGGLGLSYHQSNALQLYANFSQNYRGINFNNMSIVNPNYRVDPDLKDEKGYSADMGVRGHMSNIFNYDLSLFTIHYNDRIGTVWLTDNSSITYQYTTNISKSRNLGIESFGELDLWKLAFGSSAQTKLSIFSNFSYIDARYIHSKEPAYENKQVEFVPPVILKGGINFQRKRFSASWQYSYTAKQFGDATNAETPSNNGINGLIPSYHVMDISLDYVINHMFSVSGTINNLADNKYFTRRADSYPGPGIIPADPRSFYLTLQVKL